MSKEQIILVKCPECGKAYYVKEKDSGTKTKCPYCENWVVLIKDIPAPPQSDWEKDFDEKFNLATIINDGINEPYITYKGTDLSSVDNLLDDIKSFISTLLSQARADERQKATRLTAQEISMIAKNEEHKKEAIKIIRAEVLKEVLPKEPEDHLLGSDWYQGFNSCLNKIKVKALKNWGIKLK